MPLPLIAAGIAAGTGLLQTGLGIADTIKGNKARKRAQSFYEQNKFKIPESAKASLSNAERMASGVRLPAEDLRRSQIAEATSAGVGAAQKAATSASDVLGVLSGLYAGQQQAEQNLAISGAERFDRNQAMLRQELGRMSDWEKQRWDYNVLYPYQQQLATAGQLSERGRQGIGAGLSALGSAAGSFAQLQGAQNQLANVQTAAGLTSGDVNGLAPMKSIAPIQPSFSMGYNTTQLAGF